ncbi:MAG: hypothetical protein F4X40_08730 [Chloroflexi bacterium]|nr:hypothetical protein [Chloroflexota bacterium]
MDVAVRIVLAVAVIAIICCVCTRAGDAKLGVYCSVKDPSGGYIYQQCMAGGWKDWYDNAPWMR